MVDKKEIIKNIVTAGILPPSGQIRALTVALKKALKKRKELKTAKEKEKFQKMIDDLKSEIKLKKGDRGAAEDMPKKKADFNVFLGNIQKGKPVPLPRYGSEEVQPPRFKKTKKKGGSVKTSKYSKGGGVRSAKYKI